MLAIEAMLEQGHFHGPLARACAAVWARIAERTLVRPLELPARTRVVAIGGATLGGSGKTPLAIACAAELARNGAHVALVGHAHRAKPLRARVVTIRDALHEVGDEALIAARALESAGVHVVVAPRRADAIALAASQADMLVLDGVAQTSPTRSRLALLAVDAVQPWGRTRAVAPQGDLRAPLAALLRACDGVVAIGDAGENGAIGDAGENGAIGVAHENAAIGEPGSRSLLETWSASVSSSGAQVGGALVGWDDLSRLRIGLLCALSRPERVVRSLERRGIAIRAIVRARDHGPVTANLIAMAARTRSQLGIDLWLATPKCWLHFASRLPPPVTNVGNLLHAPLGQIDHALVLSAALVQRLRTIAAP